MRVWWMSGVGIALLLVGCATPEEPAADGAAPDAPAGDTAVPAPPPGDDGPQTFDPLVPVDGRLHRLTQVQLRATWTARLGVPIVGDLPEDQVLHGYTSIGAGVASLAPVELELLEAAAWRAVGEAMPDLASAEALLGSPIRETADVGVRGALHAFALRAWRRPATAPEVDRLVGIYDDAAASVGRLVAARAVAVAMLISPYTVFRVEVGEPDPADPTRRRFTSWEMATRLAYLLTDGPPDDLLLAAAEADTLVDEHVLLEHAERLLATDASRAAWSRWMLETLSLERVELMSKDPAAFPELDDTLRAAMVDEIRWLFVDTVFEQDAPFATLLTREDSWTDASLATLYGISPPATGSIRASLPPGHQRGGILGRAAVLAVAAHDNVTSPTRRGKLVRERMLCQSIPPPPEGVTASLDATDPSGTMRERLSQHASDPACVSCHAVMDPLGYTMEHFDALGRYRDREPTAAGLRDIDPTGDLDGVAIATPKALGAAVAAHPDFPGCVALNLFRHGTGAAEQRGQLGEVGRLGQDLTEAGGSLRAAILAFVASDGFRRLRGPLGEPCTDEERGQTRACDLGCGQGTEVCEQGAWRGCDAPVVRAERCDGVDQDCSGAPDDGVERACEASFGWGVQTCDAGAWGVCDAPLPPDEVCNGVDDDADGAIDEGLAVDRFTTSATELVSTVPACEPELDAFGAGCHAAVHQVCSTRGCGVSGFGPLDVALISDERTVVCLDETRAEVVETTFATLATHHDSCTQANPHHPGCYAAIHRFCASRGQQAGWGPVATNGGAATVVCTPGALVRSTTYTALSAFEPGCDGSTERFGARCARAFDAWCREQGHLTGYGPLENSGDAATAACLGVSP